MWYLNSRGVTQESIKKYCLGYSDPNLMLEYDLATLGYSKKLMVSSGLFVGDPNGKIHPTFAFKRVTVPVYLNGKAINICSRVVWGNNKSPKYMMLRGISWTFMGADEIKDGDDVFITEGGFDKIILSQLGVKAVSFMGTGGFKREHVKYFKKCRNIFCIPDMEFNKEATMANFKMYQKISKMVKSPKIIFLPMTRGTKEDPASFFSKMSFSQGYEILKEMAEKAINLYDLKDYEELEDSKPKKRTRTYMSKDELDSLKSLKSIPIKDILEDLGIEREGFISENRRYIKCLNPSHMDKNDSMTVYEETNTYYCFGCREGTSNLDLVMLIKDCSFAEACSYLRELNERILNENK